MLDLSTSKDPWQRFEFPDKGAGHEQAKMKHVLRAQSLESGQRGIFLAYCKLLLLAVSLEHMQKPQKMQLKPLSTDFIINQQLLLAFPS